MYKDILEIDLRHIGWEDRLWKKFLRKIKKPYGKIEEIQKGVLKYHYKNSRITEFQIRVFVSTFLSDFLDKERPLVLEQKTTSQDCILPLCDTPDSTTYLFYSTRLAIIQAQPEFHQWLMQYFIHIKLFYHPDSLNLLFFDEELEQIMDLKGISYLEITSDILDYTKEKLEQGLYVNIHLDEFYLSEKDCFDTRHYVHENLIYGFSDREKVFYAFGFARKQKVQTFIIPYEEYLMAYEKGKLFLFCGAKYLTEEYPWPVMLCLLKESSPYSFEVHDFLVKIKEFLNPPDQEMVAEDLHMYGTDIYERILSELRGEEEQVVVDFRVFQLLYEQKQCIKRRLEFLQEKYHLENVLKEFWEEYKEVERSFQRIRLIYLKQLSLEGRTATLDQCILNEKVNCGIADKLEEAIGKERMILERLVEILENEKSL